MSLHPQTHISYRNIHFILLTKLPNVALTMSTPNDQLDRPIDQIQPVTEDQVVQQIEQLDMETGVVASAAERLDRNKASLVFGAILLEGLGTGAGIALIWDGTRWLLQNKDGSFPLRSEIAGSLVYSFGQPAWEGFLIGVIKRLTGYGEFNKEELTSIQTLLSSAYHSVVGGTIIGTLYSMAKWLAESTDSHQYGWEVGGITSGFFALAGYSFLVNAYGYQLPQTGVTDNRPWKDVLSASGKKMFSDFFDFKHWIENRGPKVISFMALGVWIGPFVTTVSGTDPSELRFWGTNLALLTLFFAQTDLITALVAKGASMGARANRAVGERFGLPVARSE